MIREFDIREFFRTNRKQILVSIFLFWLVFALLILIEDKIAHDIGNLEVDPVDRLQYIIRWFLWTLLTPVVIFLSIKFPISKKKLVAGIIRHFFLALFFIAIEFSIEIPIVRLITRNMTGIMPPVSDYAAVFILKLNIYLLLYFLVVGTTYLVLYTESSSRSKILAKEAEMRNQQLHTQLAEAKLSLLKMQLDPHFLFNTHHAIVSLMLKNENEKAIHMLTRLSDLLRLSLEDQQQTILLEREIHLLKLYLEIQQIRFHDRLNISFDIDPNSVSQKVPAFILQPLVENAIKHGISLSSDAGKINIETLVSDHRLILKVQNDGAAIDFNNFKEGIGIANTKERLHQLYNNHSEFDLKNVPGEGVVARITLPIQA